MDLTTTCTEDQSRNCLTMEELKQYLKWDKAKVYYTKLIDEDLVVNRKDIKDIFEELEIILRGKKNIINKILRQLKDK